MHFFSKKMFWFVSILLCFQSFFSFAASIDWINYIKSGQPFQAALDQTLNKFDDSSFIGSTDPMGNLQGGQTYNVTYKNGSFACEGFNEGMNMVGTWSYSNADPEDNLISLWGRPFAFDGKGRLYDSQFGLVGHLKKGPAFGQPTGGGDPNVYHLFSAVPKASSSQFKANTYQPVRIATHRFDKIPYHMTRQFQGTVTVRPGQKVILAGDAKGLQSWSVDNFLLFELTRPGWSHRFVVGAVEPVTFNGLSVPQVGANTQSFAPSSLDLATQFPQNVPVNLKVSALDYGVVGAVSNVYLITK